MLHCEAMPDDAPKGPDSWNNKKKPLSPEEVDAKSVEEAQQPDGADADPFTKFGALYFTTDVSASSNPRLLVAVVVVCSALIRSNVQQESNLQCSYLAITVTMIASVLWCASHSSAVLIDLLEHSRRLLECMQTWPPRQRPAPSTPGLSVELLVRSAAQMINARPQI